MEPVSNLAGGLDRISERWAVLSSITEPLSDEEFVRPRADGWSARDHVVHVTAWERSLLALLRSESRPQAMGLTEEEEAALEIDGINAHILAQAARLTREEVRKRSLEAHAEVVAQLQSMTDEDVNLPYSHYQPGDGENRSQPVFGWIGGNTFGHYDEHIGWLSKMK